MKNILRLILLCFVICFTVSCEFHDDSPAAEPEEYASRENIIGATYSCSVLSLTFVSDSEVECTLPSYGNIPTVSGIYEFESEDDKTAEFNFDYLWEENMDEPTQVLRYRVIVNGDFESKEKLFVEELYYSYRSGMSTASYTLTSLSLYREE